MCICLPDLEKFLSLGKQKHFILSDFAPRSLQLCGLHRLPAFKECEHLFAGLAGVMGLLRERGELQQGPEWAGRTNDKKGDKLQGLEDIYKGGNHTDRISTSIEQALTQRDEFGRIMTPKERFRDLCHKWVITLPCCLYSLSQFIGLSSIAGQCAKE